MHLLLVYACKDSPSATTVWIAKPSDISLVFIFLFVCIVTFKLWSHPFIALFVAYFSELVELPLFTLRLRKEVRFHNALLTSIVICNLYNSE